MTEPTSNLQAETVRGQPTRLGSLFVSNLTATVTESTLLEFFKSIGENSIASIRVCRDNQSAERRSLGYAYVNFYKEEDADRAIDTLNFSEIDGRRCRIQWSRRDPSLRKSGVGNLFVKNLEKEIDEADLHEIFEKFGNILSIKIACDRQTNISKGYGFVHFEKLEDSEKAKAALNGKWLNGKQVYVGPFIPKHLRPNSDTNIYLKHIHEDVNPEDFDKHVTNLTKDIGLITSPKLMTKEVIKGGEKIEESKRFGFVNFENHEVAKRALERFKDQAKVDELAPGFTAQGMTLYSNYALPKEKRVANQRLPQNTTNLYVKNIGEEISEEILFDEFSPFGKITSLKIMEDEVTKIKRGFGFVCYESPDSARQAITTMNEKILGQKPLYVALAQKKEVRRQQLSNQLSQRNHRIPNIAGTPYFFPPQIPRGGRGFPRGAQRSFPVQRMPHFPIGRSPIDLFQLNNLEFKSKVQYFGDIIFQRCILDGISEDLSKNIVGNFIKKTSSLNQTQAVDYLLNIVNNDQIRRQIVASNFA